jgi:hypothetical protein
MVIRMRVGVVVSSALHYCKAFGIEPDGFGPGRPPAARAVAHGGPARYVAALGESGLAVSTCAARARCVRRFLRWLPGHCGDVAGALARPEVWSEAASRFSLGLYPASGVLGTSGQFHADALADCARRLGLAAGYEQVPDRYLQVRDTYAALLAGSQLARATADSYLLSVEAFLRWAGQGGEPVDLRLVWGEQVAAYLEHLACTGRSASTVRSRRAALGHCAALLRLPDARSGVFGAAARGGGRPWRGECAVARYEWAGRCYYLLASAAGTRVVISNAALPLTGGASGQPGGDAGALLDQAIAAQMFRAPLQARLAWAAIGGSQVILLADGEHAHLAERGPDSASVRRYPIGAALDAWQAHVNGHLDRLARCHTGLAGPVPAGPRPGAAGVPDVATGCAQRGE